MYGWLRHILNSIPSRTPIYWLTLLNHSMLLLTLYMDSNKGGLNTNLWTKNFNNKLHALIGFCVEISFFSSFYRFIIIDLESIITSSIFFVAGNFNDFVLCHAIYVFLIIIYFTIHNRKIIYGLNSIENSAQLNKNISFVY